MDETFGRMAGKCMYLFRAVDSYGQTVDFYLSEARDREAAKIFLKKVWRTRTIGHHTCSPETACGAIRRPFESYRTRGTWGSIAVNERAGTVITGSNPTHGHVKRRLRAMQGPRTRATALAVIQGIEAAQMVRKGQVLGITGWALGAAVG